MVFQMMFAVITPALIIGAFAERMKFSAFLVFSVLWATLVYDPMAHWVWGVGGWLRDFGALDFAGGTVVHINAGMAALAAALVIGKRKGYPETSPPHNLPFAILGAALLWFGWFGFNAGSALSSGGLAASAFLATHLGAAAAAVAWAVIEWITRKRPTALGIISGAVAGLVAITPASGYVGPLAAMAIGAIASAGLLLGGRVGQGQARLRRLAGRLRRARRRRHGRRSAHRLLGDHGHQSGRRRRSVLRQRRCWLLKQLAAVAVCAAFSFVVSWVLLKVIDKTMGLRVNEDSENIGLDLTQHRESAYTVVG